MKIKPTWFVAAWLLLIGLQVQAADASRALQGMDGEVRVAARLDALVKFRLDASGKPAEMLLPLDPAAADLVFVRSHT